MVTAPENIGVIVATDCGSTTTKAILIERQPDGSYRQTARGEAPTTVEAPFEDVTMGVRNSIQELAELSGRRLVDDNGHIIRPAQGNQGCDIYISTSSAGGGLQMMVAGVVRTMTAESAARAALGAGAIVMDTIASNDKRLPHQQIERIRHLRPDMILLSGGVDGGTISHVVELAELVSAADPKPRLGKGYKLPVIYAGNKEARDLISERLAEKTDLFVADNLRPTLEMENLGPARDRIHDLFMEHVMQQAPGYGRLMEITDAPIKPTPGAVGDIIDRVAMAEDIEVLGVDIGGATTDVFSVFKKTFNRTVSANLGMSYSISNVFAEAGIENVQRHIPFAIDDRHVRNAVKNKMIRPTTIPQQLRDLVIEQAMAKEALRLALEQHRAFATTLKGVQQERAIGDAFDQNGHGLSLVNMISLDLLVGSGGVLSHAPRRNQTAMMLLDAFEPKGFTRLAVDSIFMMPHLGVLADIHPAAATQVFERDCLIHLGTCVAPGGKGKPGAPCLHVTGTLPDGSRVDETVNYGELRLLDIATLDPETNISIREYQPKECSLTFTPSKGFNLGAGSGKPVTKTVSDGVVGIMLDCRGRPIRYPEDPGERIAALLRWAAELKAYDMDVLGALSAAGGE